MILSAEELFDERFYLARNPDVAAAIASGAFASGSEHFFAFGDVERRDPSAFFDTSYYLEKNPDVAAAVSPDLTALEHFLDFGQTEGRIPLQLFDPNFYRETNPDVAAVVPDDLTGLFVHYVEFGAAEGRDPIAVFDNSYYLEQNPDVAAAVSSGETTASKHFITFGQFEGRLPRPLFDEVYFFGDSLSDTGNLFDLTRGILPPILLYVNGRFSNGPVWAELFPERLGLTANPDTNFAFGGATTSSLNTLGLNNLPLPPFPGLQNILNNFVGETPLADPNGLYVVWAGANDYLGGGVTDPSIPVSNLVNSVTELAADGARNFLVPNLPDLGATPGGRDRTPEAQQLLTQLSNAHNQGLAAAMEMLDRDPNINIILFDVNDLVNDAIANPSEYELTNVTDAFIRGNGINPRNFLFWDDVHPTTRAHQIIANTAITSITAIPELVNILL